MHMSDSLISPAIGGGLWAVSLGLISYSVKKIVKKVNLKIVSLMGLLGAFIFALQMINFAIPGTGSSGHLGGGLVLSIFLGPYAAFLVMSLILFVQAVFFADGGLLALGCNIFNLGFFTCFIAYPLIYQKITIDQSNKWRLVLGSTLAAIIGLQLGAFGVVTQTFFSGLVNLSFSKFLSLMQPIHLAIGLGEGLATAFLVLLVNKVQPAFISKKDFSLFVLPQKKLAFAFLLAAILFGSFFSSLASSKPDGLEWSVAKVSSLPASKQLDPNQTIHHFSEEFQKKIAFLPDYDFRTNYDQKNEAEKSNSIIHWGTSLSGLMGGFLIMFFSLLSGFILIKFQKSS